MYPIDPGEEWGSYVIFAENQTEIYEPLYARDHPEGTTITRWKFTNKEREAIANGSDLFMGVLRFGGPLQPIQFWIEGIPDVSN